jgi:hypothetical protein
MRLSPSERHREEALTAEAVREVGVLLVALAPLDMAFGPATLHNVAIALSFILVGLFLFILGLRLERRHGPAD